MKKELEDLIEPNKKDNHFIHKIFTKINELKQYISVNKLLHVQLKNQTKIYLSV